MQCVTKFGPDEHSFQSGPRRFPDENEPRSSHERTMIERAHHAQIFVLRESVMRHRRNLVP